MTENVKITPKIDYVNLVGDAPFECAVERGDVRTKFRVHDVFDFSTFEMWTESVADGSRTSGTLTLQLNPEQLRLVVDNLDGLVDAQRLPAKVVDGVMSRIG